MANIRIKDLPVVTEPENTDRIVIDDTIEGTRSITIQDFLTTSGARFFVQAAAPATSYPNGSLWIDSDTPNLDLYQLVAAVWTDTGLDVKGTAGTNGAVAVSGTPTVNQIAAWVDATTMKGVSITGLVKGNGASAPAAAVAGTDYLAPAAIGVTVQAFSTNTMADAIEFVIDGGGTAITTGVKGYLEIPYACTINRGTLLADQSGSIVVDIFKDTYANYPPVVGDKITASAPLTISAATKSQDSTLTGWTTAIAAGDILAFNVNSITTCQRVTVSLKVTKT